MQDPDEFILVEAFEDDAAEAHVSSDHFEQAMKDMPKALAKTPLIINTTTTIEGARDWSHMGELNVG